MAITIQNAPGTYQSVHGDIIFTVCDIVKASDPVTYTDYRYVCDVYVGSEMVTRLKAYPNPTNKCGVFNIGNVLRNYIAATFNPSSGLRAQELSTGEFKIIATMKFGDEYGYTTYTNLTVDTARSYFGHYNGRLLGNTSNLSTFTDMPLTMRPMHTAITATSEGVPVYSSNKNHFVPFLATTTGSVTLEIKSYTQDDTLIQTNTQAYSPSTADSLQLYNLSPTAINTAFPGAIPLTVASYYTVKFLSPVIALDRILRFNLVCEPRYEVYTVHFLNRFGGMESRDFTKVSRKVIDIEKNEFGKLGWTMDTSGVVSYKNANNVLNEQRTVFSTGYKEKLTLNTDILTDNEYVWLEDLFLSPMVYVEIVEGETTYHVPCVIEATNYERKKRINDKLTNITMTLAFGENFHSQFR